MSEPMTKSGRALYAQHRVWNQAQRRKADDRHDATWLADITAIEREARAALLDELEAAVQELRGKWVGSRGYPGDHHGIEYVDVDAVLALIQQHREGNP